MAKCELIDKSEVMMFVDDIFECQCDEKEAYELLDNVSTITEQEIIKPYLEKLKSEIGKIPTLTPRTHANCTYGYKLEHPQEIKKRVLDLIDNLLSEQEVKE